MENPIGICQWCVPAEGSANAMQVAAECGLDGIELDLGHARDGYPLAQAATIEHCRTLRQELNLCLPSISVNMFCDIGMSDASREQEVFAALEKAAVAAEALDIPLLQLPSFFHGAIESEEQFQQTAHALRYACQCASPNGILVGSENALTAEEQIRLLDEVGHPLLRLYFDVRNLHSMKGLAGPAILEATYQHICEVHLKDGIDDGPSTPLGAGNCDIQSSVAILKRRGYGGWLVLEGSYQEMAEATGGDPLDLIREDIATIRAW